MIRDDLGLLHTAALLAVAFTVVMLDGPAQAEDGPHRFGLTSGRGSIVENSVVDAVRDARAKLASSECALVFSDFRDGQGRTLAENLAAIGESPSSYVDLLLLYDGRGRPTCQQAATYATTTPGRRTVFLCASQFMEMQRQRPGYAAAIVIHEELHSLGLRENPPTSSEITARVVARCRL